MAFPDKLQRTLVRLGSDPQRSVRLFLIGLGFFIVSVAGFYLGAATIMRIQIPAALLMLVGIGFAIKGYIGIFANRIAFFRNQSHENKQKYKHLE